MADLPLSPIQVFEHVKHLPHSARISFYDEAGASEADRIRIESWVANADPVREGPGSRIENYKLLQLIGEGGFGSVFEADQERPVKRRVAVKIIKPGMDSRAVIARFEAERQALALMDHPNIARVLDAGTTTAGRPFFVMELVKGEPITDYADRNHLTISDRLELFAQVCHAVQHAHQKGIIHRDIKPNNVLVGDVDGKPQVKVIDFGIAKALAGRLTDMTLFTEFKQFIGTPQYMSPEQADGSADIDTRSDVYSLGVLLYELLAGYKPFDEKMLKDAAHAEICRIIRDVDPPKPSTRLSTADAVATTIATARRQALQSLTRELRSELEWIPMMAIRKERNRRYASPLQMAEDIENYLKDRPLRAGPESGFYQLRKTIKRNRGLVVAFAVFVLLAATTVVSLAWAMEAQGRYDALVIQKIRADAEKAADRDKEVAREQASRLAVGDLLQLVVSASSPFGPQFPGAEHDPRISQVLDQVASQVDKDFDNHPAAYAGIAGSVAVSYTGQGKYAQAAPFARKSFESDFKTAPNAVDTVDAAARLIELLVELDSLPEAQSVVDRTGGYRWAKRVSSAKKDVLVYFGREVAQLLEAEGKLPESKSMYELALWDAEAAPEASETQLLWAKSLYAHFMFWHGDLRTATSMYREVVAGAVKMGHEPMVGAWKGALGRCLLKSGEAGNDRDLAEAEPLLKFAVDGAEKLPHDHIERVNFLIPYAHLLDLTHRSDAAKGYWQEAIRVARAAPINEPQRWTTFARYAQALRARGLGPDADQLLTREREDLGKLGADQNLLSRVQTCWDGILNAKPLSSRPVNPN